MPRQKAEPEGTQVGREMAENRSAPRAVTRVLAPAAQGLRAATRPNKRHRAGTILALVALAAGNGTSTGGFLGLGEYAGTAGRMPTAEWARQAMQARDAAGALRHLRASAARHLRTLRRRGELPAEIVVALGMHGIHRYGRALPGWLVRARPGRGSTRRERHMTAQCAANRMWAAPGAVRAVPGDSIDTGEQKSLGVYSLAHGRPLDHCLGRVARGAPARALPKLPARRGGHSQVHVRGEAGRAPDAHPRRAREGGAARHDHKEGEKERGQGPEGKHVAFATNMPSANPDAPCPRRWGTGIGHRTPRQARMRTSGRDESARTFCFVVSPMARNARAMMRPGRRAGGDGRKIPMTPPRIIIVLEACEGPGIRPPRKPPP